MWERKALASTHGQHATLVVANLDPGSKQHRSQTVSLHIKLDFTNDKAKVVPIGSNLQRLRHVFKKHGLGG